MGEGRTYMKGLCIILNILLGIFGVILFLYGLVTNNSVNYDPVEDILPNLLFSVGFGLATILLAILGVYGAYQQQVMALILYCIFMTIEFIALITLAIIAIVVQPQVYNKIEDSFGEVIPLHNASGNLQQELIKLQQEAECCGLRNYTDWNNHMPPSCSCPSDLPDKKTKCHYVQTSAEWMSKPDPELIKPMNTWNGPNYVYKMACGTILMAYVRNIMRILLGIIFTLATVKVAAVIVALLLWHKIGTMSPTTGISQDDDRIKYELQPDKML